MDERENARKAARDETQRSVQRAEIEISKLPFMAKPFGLVILSFIRAVNAELQIIRMTR